MEFKDWFASVTSLVALLVSIGTFYWTTLHKRHVFYLIRTQHLFSTAPRFVLVNGGKSDLLVTGMRCFFSLPTGGTMPPQRIEIVGNKEWLLNAGKAFHCVVRFTEKFDHTLAHLGQLDPANMNLYKFKVTVEVDWVDMHGVAHSKAVDHSHYWLDDAGTVTMHRPVGAPALKHDMYALKNPGVFRRGIAKIQA